MLLNNNLLLLLSLATTSFAAPVGEHLERRAPGSYPSSVNCNGVTFTKKQIDDALQAAWTPARAPPSRNNPSGKLYPAYNGNKGTQNGAQISILSSPQAISAASARALQEQPLGEKSTWKGGVKAGLYRVIYDTRVSTNEGSYMGVIYHISGSDFRQCTETAAAPACPAPAAASSSAAPTTRTRRMLEAIRRAVDPSAKKTSSKVPEGCAKPTSTKASTPTPSPTKPTTTGASTTGPSTTKPSTTGPSTTGPSTTKPTTTKATTTKADTTKATTTKAADTTKATTTKAADTTKATTTKATTTKAETTKATTTAKPTTTKATTTKAATTAKPTTAKPTTAKPTTKKATTTKSSTKPTKKPKGSR